MGSPMRRMIVLLALIAAVFVDRPAGAQQEGLALITEPQSGAVLLGIVNVRGTATSPNFLRYRLDYALQDPNVAEVVWQPIGAEVAQQVTNGILAQWDTTAAVDGDYQLRLRVELRDGSIVQTTIPNLTIRNSSQTPLPTPLVPATAVPPTAEPTLGPSPTPLIQQPPTLTPRPTFESAIAPTAAPPSQEQLQFVVAFNELRNAFCSGAYLALGAFGLLALYRVAYVRLRPRLRRLLMELRAEDRE